LGGADPGPAVLGRPDVQRATDDLDQRLHARCL
jgi:hypothetical protein